MFFFLHDIGIFLFSGKTGLEKSSLIKHSSNKSNQEELQRMQNVERSNTNSDNQAFLTDVSFEINYSLKFFYNRAPQGCFTHITIVLKNY